MRSESFKLWSKYRENRDLVDQSFVSVSRLGKDAIRQDDPIALEAIESLATFLLAAYVESRLNETIWYYSGMKEVPRAALMERTVEERWYRLIDIGFAKLRGVGLRQIPNGLTFTDRARRDELYLVVSEYLSPLITARNSIAHGQWKYAFASDGSTVNPGRTASLRRYSIWRLILEKNLINHFTWLVHDLVVTARTHERDFDKRIADLHSAIYRLRRGDRQQWEDMLRDRYHRRPHA
ncbi:hypothetical protein [Nocardia sp. NPDC057353]|uniref:hypothetical protein n=1 Tax=Nocardia sp. NPDC057353 TaxID=3346104 RepID=UPI0036429B93